LLYFKGELMAITNWAEKEQQVYDASFIIGAESAGDAITVNVQFLDRRGLDIDHIAAGLGYLSSDAAGLDHVAVPGSVAAGTDGSVVVLGQISDEDSVFQWVSESDGDLDVVVTGDTGADTVYLNIVLPTGQIVTSGAIVIEAD
jgi:hypothetical protein